jgi:hypothetical protein
MIFVSIASYRDKELIKTVNSCLSKAKHPENVRIGICWQYDDEEDITALDDIPQVQSYKVCWEDVEGSVCWARSIIQQKFFNDEEYYFQIDSHTLFAQDWDEILINMYNELPTDKAVISVGPPYYYDLSAEGALPYLEWEPVDFIDGIYRDSVIQKQKLDSAGGIWQFKVDKLNQSYADGIKYATGIRNCVGLDWNNEVNELFITVHGRDELYQSYPEYYDQKSGAELPSETMYMVKKGDDCGWPYVHWDHLQNKKILNPEFGGDRVKTGADNAISPLVGFPGHLAPNALLIYSGNQFPAKYKNGAFIAFHGSWNRSPEPQEGFYVVFVPMKNGKPTGKWEVFANGFAGMETVVNLSAAKHRPCGLAQGADGSLYVSDDSKGYVWKISYKN